MQFELRSFMSEQSTNVIAVRLLAVAMSTKLVFVFISTESCGSGSAFIFPPGSGSGSSRENISNETEKSKEIANKCNFIQFLK